MFELNVPIRLYWDLCPEGADLLPFEDICSDIFALKILSLTLADRGTRISPSCFRILEALKGKGTAVSVAISPEACDKALLDRLRHLGVRSVLLRVSSLKQLDRWRQLFLDPDRPVGIWFEVTAENWRTLPGLMTFCGENGVVSLSLPMQRLWDGEPCFFLEPEEKRELAEALRAVPRKPELNITIHDPFLWKLFNPSVPFPDGGCQAANTMLSISPAGDVYPCPSLPLKLGSLVSASLSDIARSSAKMEVRREIVQHPGPCAGCTDLPTCKGGCRGRAFASHGSLDCPDPGCP